MQSFDKELLNDCDLLGAAVNYTEAVDVLVSAGSLVAEVVPLSNHGPCKNLKVYTTHPVRSSVNGFSFLFYLSPHQVLPYTVNSEAVESDLAPVH
jgi:hypothetical protein